MCSAHPELLHVVCAHYSSASPGNAVFAVTFAHQTALCFLVYEWCIQKLAAMLVRFREDNTLLFPAGYCLPEVPNFRQTKETVSGQFQNNQEQDEQEGFTIIRTALCAGLNKACSTRQPLMPSPYTAALMITATNLVCSANLSQRVATTKLGTEQPNGKPDIKHMKRKPWDYEKELRTFSTQWALLGDYLKIID